ncbi:CDP-6-deoxy-delta-3,4-glucoseen reductase [Pseudomonas sp. NPDC087342]|uniref:CDP-6-deoxy-delta-3,4-glucoseen reductase n=1 Tax=Pseudomonas sp. NPDC087342 TaxID=3364437 RepID=UPI00382A5077
MAKYTVTLLPSGSQIECQSGQSILRQALNQGISIPFSCLSGVCRTCRGRVLSGEVDTGQVHPNYLNDEDRAAGFVHLCQAKAHSDCEIEVKEIDASLTHPARALPGRILDMQKLAPDVMRILVGLPANEPLYFHAGQYLSLSLTGGLSRFYSIATSPLIEGVRQFELHIRHMPEGIFTDHVFGEMKPRSLVRIEGPIGNFYLRENSEKPMILLASGTGFGPIKAIVEYSLMQGSTRPIHIYWGGRLRRDLYLHELAESWASQNLHIRYTPVLSLPSDACAWEGRVGFVHRALLEDYPNLADYQVYACGAPVVIESARRDYKLAGLPDDEFHADSFVSLADTATASHNE